MNFNLESIRAWIAHHVAKRNAREQALAKAVARNRELERLERCRNAALLLLETGFGTADTVRDYDAQIHKLLEQSK